MSGRPMIVRLDRERALRLARVVASWHRPDDMAGALDCFMGMVRGDLTEDEIADTWREEVTYYTEQKSWDT